MLKTVTRFTITRFPSKQQHSQTIFGFGELLTQQNAWFYIQGSGMGSPQALDVQVTNVGLEDGSGDRFYLSGMAIDSNGHFSHKGKAVFRNVKMFIDYQKDSGHLVFQPLKFRPKQ